MLAKPRDEQASMYVIATIRTCFDDHVSELERVGRG
jgi:hypothetical protein